MPDSALSVIASHERELLIKSESAGREAERIIAGARAEAAQITETEAAALAAEVADIRREAEHQRDQERVQRQREAEQRLTALRAQAQTSAPEAVKKVLSLILPMTARRNP